MPSNNDLVQLMELGTKEAAEVTTVGAATPQRYLPETKNCASDEAVRAQIDALYQVIQWTRNDRQVLEEEWRGIVRMENLQHDEGRRYLGRSNTYLPTYVRILQTLVSSLSRGLFPSDEYMDVMDRESGDPERAAPVKQYLQWEFERVARVRANLKPFLRPYQNFGIGVLKHTFKKEIRSAGRKYTAKAGDPLTQFRPMPVYDGLMVRARSPFYWYIYPTTVSSIEEAQVIFEDMMVPISYVKEMGLKGRWENIEAALKAPIPSQVSANITEQLSTEGGMMRPPSSLAGNQLADISVITEVWTYLVMPASQYLDHEDKRLPLPVRVVMAGPIPLSVTRNPNFDQRPPYEVSVQNQQPGSFYGYGAGRPTRGLQYLANDFANQINDNGMYALNPVTKVNPSMLSGPLKPLSPGVVWSMSDMKAVEFDRPPIEQVNFGLQLLNFVIGAAQDGGGAPPILQGANAGRGAKTATGAQILQRNAMGPLQDVVEDLELDVMIPLLRASWFMAQQWRDESVMTMVGSGSKARSMKVAPEQLLIDPEFLWLASSQALNQQQRAQQVTQLLGVVAQPAILQTLMQQGYVVDFSNLIQRIYTDGFGFRGFDTFIRKAQAMPPGAPGQPPNSQQLAGIMNEQGDRVRSALEQNGSGDTGDITPGEGDDFMQVRDNADDLAGMLGGSGGGLL